MRRNWRSNRTMFLFVSLFACSCLIFTSVAGMLAPVEDLAGTPLYFFASIVNKLGNQANNTLDDLREIRRLQDRVAELEEAFARQQAELVQLREVSSDYDRLSDLLNYTSTYQDQETVTAEVIAYDPNALLRTIAINKGSRDGIAVGMPVTTQAGLVGRVINVTANASRVLLITDPSSDVAARLNTTRAQGTVVGLLTGNLRMELIPLDAEVQDGDIVMTSGLGGDFPPDVPIGQVNSSARESSALSQTAEIRSLINFAQLEFVLVITSFQPVDISVFEEQDTQN